MSDPVGDPPRDPAGDTVGQPVTDPASVPMSETVMNPVNGREVSASEDDRRQAVVALYHANYGDLYRLAMLLLHDRAQAEDITHDAFVRLYARWSDLRNKDAALAYLRSSVVNGVRSQWRRLRVADRHDVAPPLPMPSAEESAMASAHGPAVLAALVQLPPRQRACIVLRHYLQMTEGEIAHTVGISVGSVRTHLRRASNALAANLGGTHDDH